MAANTEWLDVNVPQFTGRENRYEMAAKLTDYIFQTSQNMRYVLETMKPAEDHKDPKERVNVNGNVDALNRKIGSLQKELQAMQTKLSEISGTVKNISMTLQADGEGGGTLGKDGQKLNILGTVTVNGTPWEQKETKV